MKLIFLYGPPASGKLTVAKQLSQLTDIPLFHNHLTRDLVKDIYKDNLGQNYALVDRLRNDVFEYCAQKGTDLIFTFVYGGNSDDENMTVKSYIKSVEKHGGKVVFVELTTDKEELLKRVNNESRKQHQKLLDPKIIGEFLESQDRSSIHFVESIKVDTTTMQPDEAAKFITSQLGLLL